MEIRLLLKAWAGSEPVMLISPPWAPLRLFSSLQKKPVCAGERFHQFFCLSSCRPVAALGHLSRSRLLPRPAGLSLMGDAPRPFLRQPTPPTPNPLFRGSRRGPTVPTPAHLLMWTTNQSHLAMVIKNHKKACLLQRSWGLSF